MTNRLGRQLPIPGAGFAFANGARAFRHRNYRLFFSGQLVSLIGTWMQSVAQSWLVLQLSGDPFLLGVVAAVQFVPVLILGLFGGLIADALPKRKTLIGTQTIQMALAFILFGLTATGVVQVWHIIVLAALLGVTNAVDMPTRQAFAVELVGREDIANAVALNSATFNAARILGPAVAGLTIGAFNISIAFLLNGLSFLAVIVAYAVMHDDELNSPPRILRPRSVGEVRSTLAEGLRYVWSTPLVLLATAVIGVASTFGMNFNVIIPALAQDVLHTDAAGYGFLMAASGVGALVAALLIAFAHRSRPGLIAGGAALLGVAEIALATSGTFGLSLGLMFIVGLGAILMAATANTTIQLTVPDQLRGRTMSVYTTVFAGSAPFGGLLMGWLASRFGVGVSIAVGGIACVVVGVAAFGWLRRIRGRQATTVLATDAEAEMEPGGVPTASRVR